MAFQSKHETAYGLSQAILNIPNKPIVARRNPTNRDKAQLGQSWVNTVGGTVFFLTSVSAGSYTWYEAAQITASVTTTGAIIAGTTLTATTGFTVLAGGATITGNSTITGDLDMTGDLDVTGETLLTGDLVQVGVCDINGAGAAATSISTGTGDTTIGNKTGTIAIEAASATIDLADDAGASYVSIKNDTGDVKFQVTSLGACAADLFDAATFRVASGAAPTSPLITCGNGAPSDSVAVGSLYIRLDPTAATERLYIAVDNAGTWTNVTCAA